MTKQQALREVASHIHGWIYGSTLAEASGFDDWQLDKMSDADVARVEWAVEEVSRRICRMGEPR